MKLGVLAREREGDGGKKEERDRHTKTERDTGKDGIGEGPFLFRVITSGR